MQGFGPYEFCDQGWTAKPHDGPEDGAFPDGAFPVVSLELKESPGLCLSSAGEEVKPAADPWCECCRCTVTSIRPLST